MTEIIRRRLRTRTERVLIGVDPGLASGCIGVIEPGKDPWWFPQPRIGKYIDVAAIRLRLVTELGASLDSAIVTIEEVHSMPKQGVASTFSFGCAFGAAIGLFSGMGLMVRLEGPQRWKRRQLEGHGKDKDAAVARVRMLYPRVNLMATSRSRVAHDGAAEAILIALDGKHAL